MFKRRLIKLKIRDIKMTEEIKKKIQINTEDSDTRYQVLAYLIFGHCEEKEFEKLAGYTKNGNTFTFAANVGDFLFVKDKSYDVTQLDNTNERIKRNEAVDKKVVQIETYFEIWVSNKDEQEKLGNYVKDKKDKEKLENYKNIPDGWSSCNKSDLAIIEKCEKKEDIKEKVIKQMIVYRKCGSNQYYCSSPRMSWSELKTVTEQYFSIWQDNGYQEYQIENVIDKLKDICGSDKCNELTEIINRWNNLAKGVSQMKSIFMKVDESIKENKQIIFTGAPGTGKTWAVRKYVKHMCASLDENGEEQFDDKGELIVDKNQFKFVQFHPSYDYSDFVEGLRPVVLKGQTEPTFVRMDGVFKAFCRHIVEENNKEKNYYFIVDEINRADLAKVFGELMFGLEESYRGKDNPIITQYKNLDTYRIIQEGDDVGKAIPLEKDKDVFRDGFYIPENLYFIGTMNDIDRSVDSMDFALRRRFQWVEIKANDIMCSSLHSILDKDNSDENSEKYEKIEELAVKVISMNKKISSDNKFGLSDAYHIGPAYFKKLDIDDSGSLEKIFDTNIRSILREYTRGRKSEDIENWIKQCRKELLGDN